MGRPSIVSYPLKWVLKIWGSTWVIMNLCKPFLQEGQYLFCNFNRKVKCTSLTPLIYDWSLIQNKTHLVSAAAGKPVSFEISISAQSWATTDFCLNNDIKLNWKLNKTPCSKIHQTFAIGFQSKQPKYKTSQVSTNRIHPKETSLCVLFIEW